MGLKQPECFCLEKCSLFQTPSLQNKLSQATHQKLHVLVGYLGKENLDSSKIFFRNA